MISADSRFIHQASARRLLRSRCESGAYLFRHRTRYQTRAFDVASCLLSQATCHVQRRAGPVNIQYAPSLLKMTLNVFSKINMSSASEQSLA
jgi:hypothetical protein